MDVRVGADEADTSDVEPLVERFDGVVEHYDGFVAGVERLDFGKVFTLFAASAGEDKF